EEIFPVYGVRLIAVNDNVDTLNGDDDFSPFRNIMNELYAMTTHTYAYNSSKPKFKILKRPLI
ncbi:MAG: hypothetical protein LBK29_04285, partial [Oscillospiraceae bacterium]|nr:hypothetical protein [Oscillospiraceae bacterium]